MCSADVRGDTDLDDMEPHFKASSNGTMPPMKSCVIETLAVYDRALTVDEAFSIDFTNAAAAVPEPAAASLLLLGIGAAATRRRRAELIEE